MYKTIAFVVDPYTQQATARTAALPPRVVGSALTSLVHGLSLVLNVLAGPAVAVVIAVFIPDNMNRF